MLDDIFLFVDYKNFFKDSKKHFKQRIGPGKDGVNINHILNKNNIELPVFIKIDIEGSEYRILDELLKFQNNITGIVIEFHDFDYHKNIIYDFCKKLNIDLIHIHPNNFAPKDKYGDPTVIELTFEREPIIIGDNPTFPNELDMKNNSSEKDINLFFK